MLEFTVVWFFLAIYMDSIWINGLGKDVFYEAFAMFIESLYIENRGCPYLYCVFLTYFQFGIIMYTIFFYYAIFFYDNKKQCNSLL